MASVSAALAAVRAGAADAACVPLESSVEGAVPLTQDELTHGEPLMITAEAYVPITFDLLVRPGTELSAIRTVGAHPHGHAQIRPWLATTLPTAEAVMSASNAAAAAIGRRRGAGRRGRRAGGRAPVRTGQPGRRHRRGAGCGHQVRAAATGPGHRRRRPATTAPRWCCRSATIPGSLLAVLTEFAARGINLTRLESRPTRSKLGEYVFLVDADGHLADPAMADVLAALIRRSALLRWLGSYPRIEGTNVPAAGLRDRGGLHEAADQVQRWPRGEWS